MSARALDDADDIGRTGTAPRNECRPPLANQLIERLPGVGHMPCLDERLGDSRTAERPAVRARCEQRLAVDRLSHSGELVGYRDNAPHAIGALLFEKHRKPGVVAFDEISEHMHITAVMDSGHFDAGHEGDSARGSRAFGLAPTRRWCHGR